MTVRYGGRLVSMVARSMKLVMMLAQVYNFAGISLLYHLFQIHMQSFVFEFIYFPRASFILIVFINALCIDICMCILYA